MSSPSLLAAESGLLRFPEELLAQVVSYLPNRDIKNLRLTCSFFLSRAHLVLSRVFISANARNIEVFRAIANHETFRTGIFEIIWDDAILATAWRRGDAYDHNEPEDDESDDDQVKEYPEDFARMCKGNIPRLKHRKAYDLDDHPGHAARAEQVAAQLPLQMSWKYYKELLQQQEQVLASEADIEALRYGLQRFPSLRRITITPAAHGWLFSPLYETPMIRAFPYGFNYAIPRGWPTRDIGYGQPVPTPWNEDGDSQTEAEKNKWRGFRIVTRVLAEQEHHISELVLDVNGLNTGLNCRIFENPCDEYNNLVKILQRPHFSRIDLALTVPEQDQTGWPAFRSSLLQRALSNATGLQHVSLRTNVESDPRADATQPWSGGAIKHFIPLRTIFPVDKWPRLRHFGLSKFLVQQADVLSLLSALPLTLRSVELSFLDFLDDGGTYQDLLTDMRDTLGWQGRAMASRPKVSIGLPLTYEVDGRAIWLDNEVYNFLYSDGENPFSVRINGVDFGKGMERDAFDPSHERPWADFADLMLLGYIKKVPEVLARKEMRLAAGKSQGEGVF